MLFTYKTNKEGWDIERMLKEQGFEMVNECYWYQTLKRGEEIITLKRE